MGKEFKSNSSQKNPGFEVKRSHVLIQKRLWASHVSNISVVFQHVKIEKPCFSMFFYFLYFLYLLNICLYFLICPYIFLYFLISSIKALKCLKLAFKMLDFLMLLYRILAPPRPPPAFRMRISRILKVDFSRSLQDARSPENRVFGVSIFT